MGFPALLRSPRATTFRRRAQEGVVLAAVLALESSHAFRHGDVSATRRLLEALAACLSVAALVRRRSRPTGAFVVVAGLTVVLTVSDAHPIGDTALIVATYTVAAWRPWRTALAAAGIASLVALVVAGYARDDGGFVLNFLLLTGFFITATSLGLYANVRRAYVDGLVDRAERLQREREYSDQLAVAAERARIAHEMHDIVAHSITVMIALSDAATRLIRVDPDQALETLTSLSATGRQSLRDTRSLLGVLGRPDRTGDVEALRPMPRLSDLDALVDQVREAGLAVAVEMNGTPAALPADAQLAVYRLVQESLTNAMKHAPRRTRARVALTFTDACLRLVVDDDGAGAVVPAAWQPGGGTAGMEARVRALGGHLESGPKASGGWQVRATLPLEAATAGTDCGAGGNGRRQG